MSREVFNFAVKLSVTLVIIIACWLVGRKVPTLAGLIATAPITTLIVLFWLYSDKGPDYALLTAYTKGVLWGIIPTALFFLTAYICFKRSVGFWASLAAGSVVWLVAAVLHQILLRR